jgi:hypothetical protein
LGNSQYDQRYPADQHGEESPKNNPRLARLDQAERSLQLQRRSAIEEVTLGFYYLAHVLMVPIVEQKYVTGEKSP